METDASLGSEPSPTGAPAATAGVQPIEGPPPDVPPPDGPMALSPQPAAPTTRVPGVSESIGAALDLALAASRPVRRISLYIGILSLALVGPAVVLFLAFVRQEGGLEDALLFVFGTQDFPGESETGALSMLRITGFFGLVGLIAISFEGQIMATTVIGGAATGRSIGIRSALRLSRLVFWPFIGAALLVGILEQIVTTFSTNLAYRLTNSFEGSSVAAILVAGLAMMPFAFYQSGIILGAVGPIEALRRSTRIARARWRLALLVALAGTAVGFIETLALGAGLDLVVRVAGAAGLGFDGSALTAIVTGFMVLAGIVAIGSLLVTVAALVAAPQVYVFLRMTGYSAGLDRAQPPPAGVVGRTRLVTRPMLALIILGVLAGLAGVLTL
jgi:hypothetical protein